ncbi:MAG: hypothetical protein IBX64_13645 [Actinobacteria bacterium]|nr:hypothetical protein [Actinomycetota bacterium]
MDKLPAETVQVTKKQDTAASAHKKESHATEEQLIYANILDISMKIGLAGIIISFILYVAGIIAPKIPVGEVSNYWGMKSKQYLKVVNISDGWSWLGMYNYGDFINLFPIAFLAGITVVCYLAIVPTLLRKRDTIYAVLALLEVVVLVSAASGFISAGGH